MRAITLLLLLVAGGQHCIASEETNIAVGDWTKPVTTDYGQSLRARLLIAQGPAPAQAKPWPETKVYLELQNVSGAVGAPMRIFFDPGRGLRCEVLDASGRPPPVTGGGGSGGGASPGWVTLPYDSTIRLRADMYGYGKKPGDGLLIQMSPPNLQRWDIPAGETKAYFMSGTFTVTLPTNHVPKDFDEVRATWTGTLELPRMRVSGPK